MAYTFCKPPLKCRLAGFAGYYLLLILLLTDRQGQCFIKLKFTPRGSANGHQHQQPSSLSFICALRTTDTSLSLGASSATAMHLLLLPSSCCCHRRCFLASVVVAVTLKCHHCRRSRCRWWLLLRRRQVGAHPSCCGGARSRGARALSTLPRCRGASPFLAAGEDGGLGRNAPPSPLNTGLRPGAPCPRVRGVGRTS